MSAPGEIIAVRLPNWVGDVCMALPALARLARAGLAPVLFGKAWAADLLSGTGYRVERLPGGTFAAARALRACGARRGVVFANSFASALQMRLAGIATTGWRGQWRSPLLAAARSRPGDLHEVQSFWRLAGIVIGEEAEPPATLGLHLVDSQRRDAAAALAAAGVGARYVVLCPLAIGRAGGRSKVWPSFPLLCRVAVDAGWRVVACPGPGEEAATAVALPQVAQLPGLGLGAYAAVLAGAAVAVANDTGPMHLAAAVDAPVVGVFGVTDPARTRPWSPRAAVVGSAAAWPTVEAVWNAARSLASAP